MNSATANAALKKIDQRRARTMTSIATEAIEEMIAGGELASGDRINESTLAEQLNISRGPIREACRSLEQAGLLSNQTNHGMYVRVMSRNEAEELYELRGALAGLVGELAVERGSEQDVEKLCSLVEEMQTAADGLDKEKYYQLNLQFHNALVLSAGNSALMVTYRQIVNQLHLLRRHGLVQEGNLQVSNTEHRAITDALVKRDRVAAQIAMKSHVANGLGRYLEAF